jgi:hypothetical protein
MEILITIVSIIIFIFLVSAPIFLLIGLKKWNLFKFNLLNYFVFGVIISAFLIFLSQYGYNFDAMNEAERFKEVASEKMERTKQLEIDYFGIGWPLKAIMAFAFYIPYLLIVYLIGVFIRKD